MHFAKAHGQEPTAESFTTQTISDARIQVAAAQRGVPQGTLLGEGASPRDSEMPPTLQVEESLAPMGVTRDMATIRGEFTRLCVHSPKVRWSHPFSLEL